MSYDKELIQKTKDYFKTTEDCNKGGWILPEGEMLDFSNKNSKKIITHEYISVVDENKLKGNAIHKFMKKANAIRISSDNSKQYPFTFIEIHTKSNPTESQWRTIRKCTCEADGILVTDIITDENNERTGMKSERHEFGKCNINVGKFRQSFNKEKEKQKT